MNYVQLTQEDEDIVIKSVPCAIIVTIATTEVCSFLNLDVLENTVFLVYSITLSSCPREFLLVNQPDL